MQGKPTIPGSSLHTRGKLPPPAALSLVACLCLFLPTGCAPSSRRADLYSRHMRQRDFSTLHKQVLVHVAIVGVYNSAPAEATPTGASDKPPRFPHAGFRMGRGGVQPVSEPSFLAGAEMSQEQFEAWVKQLVSSGSGRVLVSTDFLVEPGRTNDVNRSMARSYLANWQFNAAGVGSVTTGKINPGIRMKTRISELPGHTWLLAEFDLRLSHAELRDEIVIEESTTARGAAIPAVRLSTPREAVQHVVTTVPLRNNYPTIVAHAFRQYRTRPSDRSRGGNVCQHLLLMLSARRVGQWPPDEQTASPVAPPARHAVGLIWQLPRERRHADTPPGPARTTKQESATVTPLKPAEAAAALQTLLRKNWVTCGQSVIATEGHAAAYETSEVRQHVVGVTPVPAPDAKHPYRFALGTTHAGALLDARIARKNGAPNLNARCRFGGPCVFQADRKRMLSVRQSAGGKGLDTYLFRRCLQDVADGTYEVPLGHSGYWTLSLPWRTEENGTRRTMQPDRDRLILLTSRRVEGAAQPPEKSAGGMP